MMVIRDLALRDKEDYIAMAEEFYSSPAVLSPIPRGYIERAFNETVSGSPYAKALVAESGGKAVGYALLALTYSQEAGGRVVWIDEVYVRPEARGLGAGSALIKETLARYPAARCRLELEPDNDGARRLYERLGFNPLPYVQMYRENKKSDE